MPPCLHAGPSFQQGAADQVDMPCRYGGGRVGLSETMVGAFWAADALFAFANAGARAFHFHWGKVPYL